MKNFQEWDEVKKELLRNPVVAREYKKLEPKYRIISAMIGIRNQMKLTQAQLAKKLGTKQSAIARIESGDFNPTIDFLQKLATAFGKNLDIQFK